MRPKWDEVHLSGGAMYGEMTIRKVCQMNSDTFGGTYVEQQNVDDLNIAVLFRRYVGSDVPFQILSSDDSKIIKFSVK
jgi:hypothetical protein